MTERVSPGPLNGPNRNPWTRPWRPGSVRRIFRLTDDKYNDFHDAIIEVVFNSGFNFQLQIDHEENNNALRLAFFCFGYSKSWFRKQSKMERERIFLDIAHSIINYQRRKWETLFSTLRQDMEVQDTEPAEENDIPVQGQGTPENNAQHEPIDDGEDLISLQSFPVLTPSPLASHLESPTRIPFHKLLIRTSNGDNLESVVMARDIVIAQDVPTSVYDFDFNKWLSILNEDLGFELCSHALIFFSIKSKISRRVSTERQWRTAIFESLKDNDHNVDVLFTFHRTYHIPLH